MNIIIVFVRRHCAVVYIDIIVAFSKSLEDYIGQVPRVLWLLYEASVAFKPKKFKFFSKKINYLSIVIGPGRLELAQHTTSVVAKRKHPTTQTKLRPFLGLCKVFKRFLPNFSCLAAPLNKTLEKYQAKQYVSQD